MSTESGRRAERGAATRWVVAVVIAGLVIAFGVVNSHRVEVDYLVASRDSRLVYVILGSAILGALADRLLQVRRRRARRRSASSTGA